MRREPAPVKLKATRGYREVCPRPVNLKLCVSFRWHSLQDYLEMEQPQQAEVLHYSLEHSHSNAAPQLKHNPLILKCQQQHLQRMKENAKHHNQYSILQCRKVSQPSDRV